MDEVALTPKQRECLIRLVDAGSNPYGWTAELLGVSRSTLASLYSKGLTISSRVYGGPVSYLPNDRGLRVRAALQEVGE